ncbi:MAG: site-2 protease family protein [Spirochaetia bacterium]|nr:site-2 protease family protein [Spirochaetia bacterium]
MKIIDAARKSIYSWRIIFYHITPRVWQKHVLLFIVTFFSMAWTYYFHSLGTSAFSRFLEAFSYAFVLSGILLSHELGHYIHARQYGVEATLPFFIPLPFLSPFGTLGAFIRMKSLPPDRRALFDISYWGPAMSFFTSVPAIIAGLLLSEKVPVITTQSGFLVGDNDIVFGGSLLFDALAGLLINLPDGYTILLHPIAFAGWVGLFVTAINLFPIGQLDGGHLAYVFLGKRQKFLAYSFFGILVFLALEVSQGWMFWIFMLFLMGLRHPPVRMFESGVGLDKERIRQGILSVFIFILCFIPEPLKLNAKIITKPEMAPQFEMPRFDNFHEINFTTSEKEVYYPFNAGKWETQWTDNASISPLNLKNSSVFTGVK